MDACSDFDDDGDDGDDAEDVVYDNNDSEGITV